MLIVGLAIMLYPSFSDWWNKNKASHVISSYQEAVADLSEEDYSAILNSAYEYNRKLAGLYAPFTNYQEIDGYEDILNLSGSGIIGYISIPQIRIELPVYHGTSEDVLNVAAGHLQGSSFPVGGKNTHAVISAHRGLPSAKLFTDLDQLVEGDTFTINVLGEVLTYEVETILTVKPEEIDKLAIIPESDYVTLMTCTPYGVNTHRMLLRSHRIETEHHYDGKVLADAVKIDPILAVPAISAPLVVLLIIYWAVGKRRKPQITGRRAFEKFMENKKSEQQKNP
ncbi:MAG: class C sortase [Ruminococcus sp.]|nr:class C sortase [Ruminococcus sp.]